MNPLEKTIAWLRSAWEGTLFDKQDDPSAASTWKAFFKTLETYFLVSIGSTQAFTKLMFAEWEKEAQWPRDCPVTPATAVELAATGSPELLKVPAATRKAMGRYLVRHSESMESLFIAVGVESSTRKEQVKDSPGTEKDPPSWDEMERRIRERKIRKSRRVFPWFQRAVLALSAAFLLVRQSFAKHPVAAWSITGALAVLTGVGLMVSHTSPKTDVSASVRAKKETLFRFALETGMTMQIEKKGTVEIGQATGVEKHSERNLVSLTVSNLSSNWGTVAGIFRVIQVPAGSTAPTLDEEFRSSFELADDGQVRVAAGVPQPSVRGVPSFPAKAVLPGERWSAPFEIWYYDVKPPFRVHASASYAWVSNALVGGEELAVITIDYGARQVVPGRESIAGIHFSNHGVMQWHPAEARPVRYEERHDELWYMSDGSKVAFGMSFVSAYAVARPLARREQETVRKDLQAAIGPSSNAQALIDGEGVTVRLGDILFAYNSAQLTEESKKVLDRIRPVLGRYPNYDIRVGGHADSTGSGAHNDKLSLERAKSVTEYLSKGGGLSRVFAQGFGAGKPVADNRTAEGRSRNRRVEITLRQPGQ